MTVRYWAGAQRTAGRATDQRRAATVGELLDQLAAEPALAAVIASCSVLLDGQAAQRATPLIEGSTVDVLPPFAGG